MRLHVRVSPRAKRNVLEPQADGSLRAYTTTAPTDGKATEAVIKLLAAHLHIAKSRVLLISGAASRNKIFEII